MAGSRFSNVGPGAAELGQDVRAAAHAKPPANEEFNEEQLAHGGEAISTLDYVWTARHSRSRWRRRMRRLGRMSGFS